MPRLGDKRFQFRGYSSRGSLGYYEMKEYSSWFDGECSRALADISGGKGEYLKDNIKELTT
jgi:hypothetical protein